MSHEDRLADALHASAPAPDPDAPLDASPAPDDRATPVSWNHLTSLVAQALQTLDARLGALLVRVNEADARFQIAREAVSSRVQSVDDQITDVQVVSPTHEYHLTDSFVSDRQVDQTSTSAVDLGSHAVTLRQTGFASVLAGPSAAPVRVDVTFDDATASRVLRGLGHRYGIVAGASGAATPDPEDLQVLSTDLRVLAAPSPHHAVDLEQVAFMDTREKVALHRLRRLTGAHNIEIHWPISLLRLGTQPDLDMTVVVTLASPVTINRVILTQQPVAGSLADIHDVAVVSSDGTRSVVLSGPVKERQVAAAFAPMTVTRVQWGLRQSRYTPIPISVSHEIGPGGIHKVAPV